MNLVHSSISSTQLLVVPCISSNLLFAYSVVYFIRGMLVIKSKFLLNIHSIYEIRASPC